MNGFRNWFSRYMYGRYGNDDFNRFLLIIAAILIVIGIFVPKHFLNVLVAFILIYVYCRMFSRNISRRQQENMKFLEMKSRVTGGRGRSGSGGSRPRGNGTTVFRKGRTAADDGKRIYICPNCKGSLKVPVGAGRIRIRCPHCGSTFEENV